MQNNEKVNYNQFVNENENKIEMIPPEGIRQLLLALATSRVPKYNGRTYSVSEVTDLARRQTNGEKVRKVPVYVCDFLAEQGAKVVYNGIQVQQAAKPQQVYVSPPVLHIKPVDTTVSCVEKDLPINNGIVDAMGIRSDEKKYPYGVKLREDIGVFCTFLRVDLQNDKLVWVSNVRPMGPYAQFKLTGDIPFKLLDTLIPPRKMKGLNLYEFLISNKDYHKFVRTVVATMMKNDLVPVYVDGKPLVEEGQFCDQYANSIVTHTSWTELVREFRPAPLSYKVKPEYQGAQYMDSMFTQINKKTFLRVNNGYYDGLDASVERDAIRSKIEIIMEYAHLFPKLVYIITGVQEEGISLQKSLGELEIESYILSERSAHNYNGFHIWMKERNIEDTKAIADKLTVKPIVAKDGAILRAVYANFYAYGFGFMTNLLVNHYERDRVPTATAVGSDPVEYCEVVQNNKEKTLRYFKQLPSRKPLHYYPYIYSEDGIKYPGTNAVRLERTWFHMWTLLSWVRSKVSLIHRLKYPAVSIYWRKGKDILDHNVEDLDFQELVQTVKSRDSEAPVATRRIISRQKVESKAPVEKNVDLGRRVIQKQPVPPRQSIPRPSVVTSPPIRSPSPPMRLPPEKEEEEESDDSQLQPEDDE